MNMLTVLVLFFVSVMTFAGESNPACIPVERDDWSKEYSGYLKNKYPARRDCDILFLGDSLIHSWSGSEKNAYPNSGGLEVWNQFYKPLKAANLGVSGDRVEHVLWRITVGGQLEDINPKVIVLLIGTNNLTKRKDQPAQIAEGIKLVIDTLKRKLPTSNILLLGLLPRYDDYESEEYFRTQVNAINEMIRKYDDSKRVFYLDVGKNLLNDDGTIKKDQELFTDGCHLTPKGYQLWAKSMNPKLFELLGLRPEKFELLPNPGFEQLDGPLPTGWFNLTGRHGRGRITMAKQARTGKNAVAIDTLDEPDVTILYTGTTHGGVGGMKVIPGAVYRAEAVIRGKGPFAFNFNLRDGSGGYLGSVYSEKHHLRGEWLKYTYDFKVPDDIPINKIGFGIALFGKEARAIVDDVSLHFDPAMNPEIENIHDHAEKHRKLVMDLEAESAISRKVYLNGVAVPAGTGTVELNLNEGINVVGLEITAGSQSLRLKTHFAGLDLLDRRWKVSDKANPDWLRLNFDDRAWQPLPSTISAARGQKLYFRQIILWNQKHYGPNRCFVPPVKELEFPLSAVQNLQLALYSPLSFPLTGFTLNFSLPDGLKLLELDSLPQENGNLNVKPLQIRQIANSYSLAYGDGNASSNKTHYTYLPIRMDKVSVPGQSIEYYRSANGNFTELPQQIPIKTLPEIKGGALRKILIQQYVPVPAKRSRLSTAHLREYVRQNLAAGFNSIMIDPTQVVKGSAAEAVYREYLAQNPEMKIFLSLSMGFPMQLKLWGGVPRYVRRVIDWANAHPQAKPRYFDDRPSRAELWQEGASGVFYGTLCPSFITGPGRVAYKQALTEVLRTEFAAFPQAVGLFVDWEEGAWGPSQMGLWCFCDRCKAAFKKQFNITREEALDDQRIRDHYSKQWEQFRTSLEGRHFRIISEVCHDLNKNLQVYSWEGNKEFWKATDGCVDLSFCTVPGNSPADGYRQKVIDESMAKLKKWVDIDGIVGQRFPQLPPQLSSAANSWKDRQVCSDDGFFFDTKSWKTQLLRIIAGTHYGVDLQCAAQFPAGALYSIGEATRIISRFEDMFLNGERVDHLASSAVVKYPNLLVLRKNGERLVLAFNETDKPVAATINALELPAGRKAEVVGGPKDIEAAAIKVVIPPKDVTVIFIR